MAKDMYMIMAKDMYICKDMDEYVTKDESETLFNKKRLNREKIQTFIRDKVKKYKTFDMENSTTTKNNNMIITIPENIKNAEELRGWLYTYIKMCKYYTSKYSTDKSYVMSSKSCVSIYEMIQKIFNYNDFHQIYEKTHYAKKEHTLRIYGYTFHTISIKTFNDIVQELSLFVQ